MPEACLHLSWSRNLGRASVQYIAGRLASPLLCESAHREGQPARHNIQANSSPDGASNIDLGCLRFVLNLLTSLRCSFTLQLKRVQYSFVFCMSDLLRKQRCQKLHVLARRRVVIRWEDRIANDKNVMTLSEIRKGLTTTTNGNGGRSESRKTAIVVAEDGQSERRRLGGLSGWRRDSLAWQDAAVITSSFRGRRLAHDIGTSCACRGHLDSI